MPPIPPHPYTVELVHCCECDHPDFAVTAGVRTAYGLPELFVWSVPDEGLDGDEHWKLSERDQGAVLDAAVDRALPGGLAVGDTWDGDLDGGRSVLRVTVVPADPDLPVDPDVPLLRLHLRLVRPPIGTPHPWEPAAAVELHRRLDRWAEATGLPVTADCTTGAAGVALMAEILTGLSEDDAWICTVLESASSGGTRTASAEVDALTRTAGRTAARASAFTCIDGALEHLPDDRTLRRHVGTAFRTAANAWLMLDLLDDELFRRATASVRATVSRVGIHDFPLPLPRQQQTKVRRLLKAPLAVGVEPDLDHFEAAWCLAWSGRGAALADLCVGARAWKARDQRIFMLLAAAAVSDLRPDLLRLLPPGHRLAA